MGTRNILDVKTIVAVGSLVALVSLAVWSVGIGLTSIRSLQDQVNDLITQRSSLQTQVTRLQNQVASIKAQLANKQKEIETLEMLVVVYRGDIANLIEPSYLYTQSGGNHGDLMQ